MHGCWTAQVTKVKLRVMTSVPIHGGQEMNGGQEMMTTEKQRLGSERGCFQVVTKSVNHDVADQLSCCCFLLMGQVCSKHQR